MTTKKFTHAEVSLQVIAAAKLRVARWSPSRIIARLREEQPEIDEDLDEEDRPEPVFGAFGLTKGQAQHRLKKAYALIEDLGKESTKQRIALARAKAEREIRRLSEALERGKCKPNEWALFSRELRGWERHLAQIDGILLGRADLFAEEESHTFVLAIPKRQPLDDGE